MNGWGGLSQCWKCGGWHQGALCPTFDRPQQVLPPMPVNFYPAPLSDADVERIAKRVKELMKEEDHGE